ncbi:MAG: DUF177 domain-containing protein [Verrucomicrobiota bacterium]
MTIDVREIPDEGIHIEGAAAEDIFQLKEKEVQPNGRVSYQLRLERLDDSILVRGAVEAPFMIQCVRCLAKVPLRVALTDWAFYLPLEELKEGPTIDLTDPIREDILLALPTYPHCEDGTPEQICPRLGQFEEPDDEDRDEGESDSGGTWAGLDDFRPS